MPVVASVSAAVMAPLDGRRQQKMPLLQSLQEQQQQSCS